MDANKLENIISGYGINADDAAWLRALAQQPAAAVPADACPACGKNWGEHRLGYSASSCKQKPAAAVPAGWREHVEDRIRTWRQSFVNRHGYQLEIRDFMGSDSLDDLIDYVCSGQVQPAQPVQQPAAAVPARTLAEYHEDFGPVVWWRFPVEEHAWIGTPNDDDWPGYHTHWTPHPEVPAMLAAAQGVK